MSAARQSGEVPSYSEGWIYRALVNLHLIVVLLICMVPVALAAFLPNNQDERDRFLAEGEGRWKSTSIIRALAWYHADHGEYPEQLEMLVPAYLDEIPDTERLGGWNYWPSDQSYRLGFSYTSFRPTMICGDSWTYSSDTKEWTTGGSCE